MSTIVAQVSTLYKIIKSIKDNAKIVFFLVAFYKISSFLLEFKPLTNEIDNLSRRFEAVNERSNAVDKKVDILSIQFENRMKNLEDKMRMHIIADVYILIVLIIVLVLHKYTNSR
ncbi:6610_t:CDS:2 [Ambispora gerdemannii]|uniref:6610_t:CDS:1 n=1 Tax=Ambispora gerdemannii TaxID=144530 RepID=A0A9N9B7F6_9GLOM|nr:6610_t:CDS:2 [Ambispora gerdemannii]